MVSFHSIVNYGQKIVLVFPVSESCYFVITLEGYTMTFVWTIYAWAYADYEV